MHLRTGNQPLISCNWFCVSPYGSSKQILSNSQINVGHEPSPASRFDGTTLFSRLRKFKNINTNSSVLIGLRYLREVLNIFIKSTRITFTHEYTSGLSLCSFSESEVENYTCPSFANKTISWDTQVQTLRCISMPQFASRQALKCLGETLLDQVPYNSAGCFWESRAWSLLTHPVTGSDSALLCDKFYTKSCATHLLALKLRTRLCGVQALSHWGS